MAAEAADQVQRDFLSQSGRTSTPSDPGAVRRAAAFYVATIQEKSVVTFLTGGMQHHA